MKFFRRHLLEEGKQSRRQYRADHPRRAFQDYLSFPLLGLTEDMDEYKSDHRMETHDRIDSRAANRIENEWRKSQNLELYCSTAHQVLSFSSALNS
jgi:hypothetical protein